MVKKNKQEFRRGIDRIGSRRGTIVSSKTKDTANKQGFIKPIMTCSPNIYGLVRYADLANKKNKKSS